MAEHRGVRRLLVVAALAVTSVAAPLSPAVAQDDGVRDITDFACPADRLTSEFDDLGDSPHALAIRCIADYEITQGTGPRTYTPGQFVTRGQMATFLFRLLLRAGVPMTPNDQGFTDIQGHPHERSINGVASVEVARGTSPGRFSPDALVSRGQMATFLVRSITVIDRALPAGPDAFGDDEGSAHEPDIDALAAAGIVQGVAAGRYDPSGVVTRASMGTFLARTLDLLVEVVEIAPVVLENILMAAMGAAEEPEPADEGGSGGALLWTIGQPDVVCYVLLAEGLSEPATAAHVHQAPRGEAGAVVLPLNTPRPEQNVPGIETESHACVKDEPSLVSALVADPEDFYVNVHTDEFPDGAVRGQLGTLTNILTTTLTSGAEVPGPGAEGSGGLAALTLSTQPDHICSAVAFLSPEPSTAAHIHRGERTEAGPVVVPVDPPAPGQILQVDCQIGVDGDVLAEVATRPSAFYVNVHTETYPDGAARGQLVRLARLTAPLTGGAEAPGPGDPDGRGFAELSVVSDTAICYAIAVEGIDQVAAAHIHRAPAGQPGPIVVPLEEPVDGTSDSCASDLDPALVNEIADNPGEFYVNVHTAAYPNGAVRGQLVLSPTNEVPLVGGLG